MFRIYCDNKGCNKDMEPLLNLETGKVECTECGGNITNVTSFAIGQMKSMGQVKRDQKVKQAFSVQCKYCTKENGPYLNDKGQICCSACKKHLDYLAAPFAHMLKQQLETRKNNTGDISVSVSNVTPKINTPVR